jgi:hypothetical protein
MYCIQDNSILFYIASYDFLLSCVVWLYPIFRSMVVPYFPLHGCTLFSAPWLYPISAISVPARLHKNVKYFLLYLSMAVRFFLF